MYPENLGIVKFMERLRELNPWFQFQLHSYDTSVSPAIIIFGTHPGKKLLLPTNYYYDTKNGITNKGKTGEAPYESFSYVCDPDHPSFEPIRKQDIHYFLFRLYNFFFCEG